MHPLCVEEETGGTIRCTLCPRRCTIPSGHFGVCGVRGNKNGICILPFYGHITAVAVDPIEKKPLYHFRPGSPILSAGFAGCNLRCPFCQNWHISQTVEAPGRLMPPENIVSAALHEKTTAIAYTYSEPLVHIEYLFDCMTLAHSHGLANVLVTNGCANTAAAQEILSLTDATNIDLKCFSTDTYAQTLGGDLETVCSFIRLALEKGVHVELTTLVVPGLNDSTEELDSCADFIAGLKGKDGASCGAGIPWHLSAYHPDHRWNAPPTDPAMLIRAAERARKKIRFVYTGNIAGEQNNTACPHCGSILVRRRGYRVETVGLADSAEGERFYHCAKCGEKTPIHL